MMDSLRILSVDDTPDDRLLVRREAEAVFPAADIVEAGTRDAFEAAMSTFDFDLVVTDLALGWGDGREVLARVRDEHPDCPVIMFTGSGDETVAVDLMKAGLDDYVVKSARQLPRLRASLKIAVENARHRSALTDRERQLAAAVAHERTLVRELHHRVKNNLQTIISLLEIRARTLRGDTARHLDELAGRMRALGAVQARLYDTETFDRVDFAAALGDMAGDLTAIYENITLERRIEAPLDLDVARAMPLGLLIYEIMINALKHAWSGGVSGTLRLLLHRVDGAAEIVVVDDGVGFIPGDVAPGLGTRLTRALAKEAGVELQTSTTPGKGTRVVVRIT